MDIKDAKEIVEKSPREEFLSIQKEIMAKSRKNKRIIVLINKHEVPWYGKPNPYAVRTNSFNRTSYAYLL